LRQREQRRAPQRRPGCRLSAQPSRRRPPPLEDDPGLLGLGGRSSGRARLQARRGTPYRGAEVDQLDLGPLVAVAVARLVRGGERLAQLRPARPTAATILVNRQLEGLAPVAQLVAHPGAPGLCTERGGGLGDEVPARRLELRPVELRR